jgi:RNA-binding protein YhbY
MAYKQTEIQIGKNGLTAAVIENLRKSFETHTAIKVSVLKSAGHEKNKVKEMADRIIADFGNKFTYRILGFTIILRKWRKEQDKK